MEYKLFINGTWVEGGDLMEVTNKYSGDSIGAVVTAREEDVERAVQSAYAARSTMASLTALKRYEILMTVVKLLEQHTEDFARLIAMEGGKPIKSARGELMRALTTFTIAAEEAKRIHGEVIPMDAVPNGEGYFGFWHRRPIGVVVAIAPFNFPLNLVAHKVAPAIAAGCPVVLKPASTTPLTSCLLVELLHEAGVPAGGINLINGSGSSVGNLLVKHPQVSMVTFTGSAGVGKMIIQQAGIKRVTLELGNTSPVIITPDANLDRAVNMCATAAYANAGQVCISVQRIYADAQISDKFTERFVDRTEAMVVGDPLDERVDVGPLIQLSEAERIENWVSEAQSEGAQVLTGGRREAAVYWPTVLQNVQPYSKVCRDEVFGPVASIFTYDDFEEALQKANDTEYGLQAALFTDNYNHVLRAMDVLDFGGLIVNQAPAFRADHMPYGGNRQSGLGREGLRFAIEEMTNMQMVVFNRTE